MSIVQTVAPSTYPVSVADAKSHLNIDTTADDTLIETYIKVAVGQAQAETKRQFLTATWQYQLSEFKDTIVLPRGAPLSTVSSNVSITYVNSTVAGASSTTVPSTVYHVDFFSIPAKVYPTHGNTWPTPLTDTPHAVTVTYVSGWSTPGDVPDEIQHWIKTYVGELYEERERVTTDRLEAVGYDSLLDTWKVEDFTRYE